MLVCKQCKSDNVDVRAWVNINTNKFTDDIDDTDPYCNDCCEDVDVELMEEVIIKKDKKNTNDMLDNLIKDHNKLVNVLYGVDIDKKGKNGKTK